MQEFPSNFSYDCNVTWVNQLNQSMCNTFTTILDKHSDYFIR